MCLAFGKGVGAVIPNLLLYPGSAFVVDLKGENVAVTTRHARESMGHRVFVIDSFNVTKHEQHGVNLLDGLDPDSEDVVDQATTVADMMVISDSHQDSHWNDSARDLIRGLILYVISASKFESSVEDARQTPVCERERTQSSEASFLATETLQVSNITRSARPGVP